MQSECDAFGMKLHNSRCDTRHADATARFESRALKPEATESNLRFDFPGPVVAVRLDL